MESFSVLACATLVALFLARSVGAHEKEPINTGYAPPVEDPIFDWTVSGFDREDGTVFSLPAFSLEAPVMNRMQFELVVPIIVSLGRGWGVKAAAPVGVTDESDNFGVQAQLTYLLRLARHPDPGHNH